MNRLLWYIMIPLFLISVSLPRWISQARRESTWRTFPGYGDPGAIRLPEEIPAAREALERSRGALLRARPSRPYIVVDTHANTLTLRTEDSILLRAVCSTGSGGSLRDRATGRRWVFSTPSGIFHVTGKLEDPWWRKPDWAFIEEDEPIPSDPSQRMDPEMMGEYALSFGDGYFIHGTIYERLLGVSVTHGCVRLGSEDLRRLYRSTPIGTPVYIF